MSERLPLPAQRQPRLAFHPRGERDGVRGGSLRQRRCLWLPLTLALSPQAGRGNPRSLGGTLCLLVLTLMLGLTPMTYAADLTFDLKIEGGKVAPGMRLVRVKEGDRVKLRWSSDRAIVLHLHGYDIERKVEPGAVAEMAFVARATGRFSVEEHKTDAKGGHSHGEAALVRIEVLPK
jgi:hypothetical protein